MTTAHLMVRPPPGRELLSASSDTPTALAVGGIEVAGAEGWLRVPLRALSGDGRVRLTLRYSDRDAGTKERESFASEHRHVSLQDSSLDFAKEFTFKI